MGAAAGPAGLAAVPVGGGGAAPVTWRCTRYVALHLLRGGAPEQKGCNAYGSGVAPTPTSPTADTHTSPWAGIAPLGVCARC